MPKLQGVQHKEAIRVFERVGYRIMRQSKHVVMTNGIRILVIPRNNPINAYTMGRIIRDAGMTVDEFKRHL